MADAAAVEELRAVLAAYKMVKDASWPDLHPRMVKASPRWPHATEAELKKELQDYLDETAGPGCSVRVFWKLGDDLRFAGCNPMFAKDAGLGGPAEMIGLDDFSEKLPWNAQAAKYRFDDKEVVDSGKPKLDILERQNSAKGTVWVLVGKAPVQVGKKSIGILGIYDILDQAAANKILAKRRSEGLS
jgi:hypothetical protein